MCAFHLQNRKETVEKKPRFVYMACREAGGFVFEIVNDRYPQIK